MAIESNKKGFTLVELIVVVAIMAVLIALLTPNVIKYIDQANVGKDISTLDMVREAVEAEITDELLSSLNTNEGNEDNAVFKGMYLSDIYDAKSNPKDGKWGTLGYRIFENESVLTEPFKENDIFSSRAGEGGKIKIYLNGKGGVIAVGVDSEGKIINNGERDFLTGTKFSEDELSKLDCR